MKCKILFSLKNITNLSSTNVLRSILKVNRNSARAQYLQQDCMSAMQQVRSASTSDQSRCFKFYGKLNIQVDGGSA